MYDFVALKVCKSDIPEKWRAKALSKLDPASIDKVRSLRATVLHSLYDVSDIPCLVVITAMRTSVS